MRSVAWTAMALTAVACQQQSRGQQGAAGQSSQGEQQASGTLASASDTQVKISGVEQPLKVDSATKVTLDGSPSSAAALPEGSQVRASYLSDGTALRIDATSKR